ncbi:hypothetical protein PsAD37_04744 [Pseudovibrio sp. Ad37]|nr:hypothetical protein PsAD37_04744 [Pseudovibrio sp. Ad37]
MRLNGEPARVRTVDLLIKSQLLYQLSYGLTKHETSIGGCIGIRTLDRLIKSQLLYQLSYTPKTFPAEAMAGVYKAFCESARPYVQLFENVLCKVNLSQTNLCKSTNFRSTNTIQKCETRKNTAIFAKLPSYQLVQRKIFTDLPATVYLKSS